MAISRREVLGRSGVLALNAMAWPGRLPGLVFRREQSSPAGDVLIVVFQRGGVDGLNMVPPYGEEASYFRRRPTIGIPAPDSTAARKAVDLDGFFGLHPALAAPDAGNWIEWYQEGMLAVVHAAHMDNATRSHFDAMDYMERGTPGEKRIPSGWLGRHLAAKAMQNGSAFRAVGIGTMLQQSLRGQLPAVTLESIAEFRLQGRPTMIERFGRDLEQIHAGDDWLDREGQATFAALDLLAERVGQAQYRPSNGAQYGTNDGFHRGLMQIAQLIKADIGLEVACVDINGWDHHADEVTAEDPTAGNLANMLLRMGTGLTAFLTDMRDYLGNGSGPGITIVTMSEFGRRASENASRGTDHGHGNVMFLLGRAVNGRQVFTRPWPGLAEDDLDRGDLAGTTEYRDVLGEILSRRLGNDRIADVFPHHTFDFPGLVKDLVVPPTATPTEEPTTTATPTRGATVTATATTTQPPTATATPDVPRRGIYLPWAGRR